MSTRKGIPELADEAIRHLQAQGNVFLFGDAIASPRFSRKTNLEALEVMPQQRLKRTLRRFLDETPATIGIVAEDILYNPDLPFERITGLVNTPTFREDLSLITTPGLDRRTGIFYAPDPELRNFTFGTDATKENAAASLKLLQELLTDFPFLEQSAEVDKLTYISALLTLFLRSAIPDVIPSLCLDGNDRSVGKSLLCSMLSYIVFDVDCATMSAPTTKTEWSSKIDSILLAGTPFQVIDNIVGEFANDDLAGVLTARRRNIRIKGQTKIINVPHNTFWVFNGNEMKVDSDMAERLIRCRLQHPDARSRNQDEFFIQKEYQLSLPKLLKRDRAKYMQACLNIICAWVNAGAPRRKQRLRMAKYGEWESVLGGIFDWLLGEQKFLSTHSQHTSAVDTEKEQTITFLRQLMKVFPTCASKSIGVSEIVARVFPGEGIQSELRDFIPSGLLGKTGTSFSLTLGHWLKNASTRRWDGITLIQEYDMHEQVWKYKIGIQATEESTTQKKAA